MKIPLYIIYALLAAFFAALVPIFGKLGLRDVDSTVATVIRAFIMFIFLLLVALAMGKTDTTGFDHRALLLVALSGLAGALSWLFYFMAIKNGRTTAVIAIDKMSVALAIVLAWIILGDKMDFKTAVGAVLIVLGALLVSL
ncbi:EamA family transporter [Thermococcus sp. Bubb.Bath]|uniref:EamA family transporter n=1 Tax=Thermococcus sp. Bubb.Bath TaxID=1638242 RepID=UPI0016BD0588|nr:EamA family transporter [Thermococcus sp. Bubb.Bath]NJF25229.1 EamA family transporter [Thermococcus sp. Bubb.Bath]